jgi:hypothetical protein
MKNFRFILAVLTICLFAASAFAQNAGSLVGTVVDQQGGAVANATVVVTGTATGKDRTIQTSDEGTFTIPQLEVGLYTVKVTATGFKTHTATQVKIDVAKSYSLQIALEPGGITENVTVVAGADIINSADAQLSTTVNQRQILELPLNGRNPLSLILLQAGTSSNSAQNTTINGQRSSFTNITRDGINVQDNFIRANAVDFIPDRANVDDVGEFTIVTQNAGAELGYGSSQVQLVTPRGTSEYHGALYYYNRASHFASNTFFNNFSKVPRPFLNRNQYGGKFSGPFPLPRFGEGGPSTWKNKAFFYGAYEGFRLRQSTSANRTILLPGARTGLFTYRDLSGVNRTINLLGGNFAATTGVSAIDPIIASRILANLPTAGNNASIGDQLNTTGLSFSRGQGQNRDGYTTRFDVEANDKHSFNLIYSYKKEFLQRPDVDFQQGLTVAATACCYTTTPYGFQDAHTPFIAGSWHWTPSSSLTNELRLGQQKSSPAFGSSQTPPAFYLQVPLINNPEAGFDAQGRDTTINNIQDNAVWVRGSHSIRFGGQFQQFKAAPFGPGAFGASFIPTYALGGGTTPAFSVTTFNNAAGCVAATGVNCISSVTTANNLLALLGGLIGTGAQTFTGVSKTGSLAAAPPLRELDYENYSFYAADQWRATPRLTLNFGLRYELFSPIREANGRILEPVLGGRDVTTAILDPNGTYDFVGANGNGNNFFKWDRNNFAPVFSFAWSPTFKSGLLNGLFPGEGRTVIRGGYRRSYVNDEFIRAADNALSGNAGLTLGLTTQGNFRTGTAPSFTAPPLQVPRTYAQNNTAAANFGTVFAINPNLQVPSTDEINFGIEREIGWKTAVEARYVMGRSNNLVRGFDLNQVKIFPNGFYADFLRARNNIRLYGSGQVNCTVSAARPDCQPLQVLNAAPFNTSVFGNPLGFSNTINPIVAGDVGQLAFVYLSTFGVGNSVLLNNRNTGVVDLLRNGAKYRYNALQTEIRRRFSGGLSLQANYTFQKSLTDAPGTGQTRFEPLIDNAQPNLEYAIADTDTTHVFNLNMIYELPFGKGKRFVGGANGVVDRILGGWQVTSIFRIDSGAPFSITDPRGTLNRVGRSGRQTAITSLSKAEVKKLVGTFRTACGIFFINPAVINLDLAQCGNGVIAPRVAGTTAGVASLGFSPITGAQTFPGQVFFNVAPGQTGNMERNFVSGPTYFKWDASIIKNIRITENTRFQIRAEAFNVLNRSNFAITNQFTQANINSNTFGRLLATFDPRIIQFAGRFEF